MADEDDEKFLYGGKEKLRILRFQEVFSTLLLVAKQFSSVFMELIRKMFGEYL